MSALNITLALASVFVWLSPLLWYFRKDLGRIWDDYRTRWTR